jgi:hypothetical protein
MYEIRAYMQGEISKSWIGEIDGVPKTRVCRELKRNEGHVTYDPEQTHIECFIDIKGEVGI